MFLGSYPITPASDILHELSKHKRFGIRTFQAEDEISGVGAALGAAFGGSLGVTTTSGPGMCLKAETVGLAVAVELPLVVCDIQRAGPSTGMPTKTEQADLLMALYGRNGESPLVVLAPATPGDCFTTAIEATRIAVKYRTPVIILSDGYLANGSEPWRIPELSRAAGSAVRVLLRAAARADGAGGRASRSCRSSATRRRWPGRGRFPARPGLEHRIGGIEKADGSGDISYDPDNHDKMVRLRQAKIDGIAADIPPLEVDDPDGHAPGAGARLGLDVRLDRRRGPPGPARRRLGRPGPPAAPVAVPGEPRRRAEAVRQGAGARDQHSASWRSCCAAGSWST